MTKRRRSGNGGERVDFVCHNIARIISMPANERTEQRNERTNEMMDGGFLFLRRIPFLIRINEYDIIASVGFGGTLVYRSSPIQKDMHNAWRFSTLSEPP
jgi:hypothetical protein